MRNAQRKFFIQRQAMLRLPQQDVAGDGTFEPRLEPPLIIQQHQANTVIRTAMHQLRGKHDYRDTPHCPDDAAAPATFSRAPRPLAACHSPDEIGVLGHHIKCILNCAHICITIRTQK